MQCGHVCSSLPHYVYDRLLIGIQLRAEHANCSTSDVHMPWLLASQVSVGGQPVLVWNGGKQFIFEHLREKQVRWHLLCCCCCHVVLLRYVHMHSGEPGISSCRCLLLGCCCCHCHRHDCCCWMLLLRPRPRAICQYCMLA